MQPKNGAAAGLDQIVLRLRLIGPMAAWTLEPLSVLPPGRKTRAMLAILAMSMPRGMPRARLAEMLWSGRPEEQSRASLRQELHRLQDALSATGHELLQVSRDQVGLRPGLVWVDTTELFQATNEHPSALVLMDRELLEGFDGVDPVFDIWLSEQRERLRLRARDLAEGLLAGIADPDMAMLAAQRLLSIDSAHEGAWRALIRGFALRGEHGMAIQAFERCKAALAEHLGAMPSPETTHLVAQIRGRTATGTKPPVHRPATPEPLAPQFAAGPRVGVLPPRLIGDGSAMLPMSIMLADEITGQLSRARWFTAISSAAVQRFSRSGEDERTIRAVLGIDYLLDGTLQYVGNRIRLAVRLIDLTAEQNLLWADRFDTTATDVFAMQDRLAAEISARVDAALLAAEGNRDPADTTRPTSHLHAVALMMRLERADFIRAGEILAEATISKPARADVFGWYSFWHLLSVLQGWEAVASQTAAQALAMAERAQSLDQLDARIVVFHGLARLLLFGQPLEALALYERAVQLNPHQPAVWALGALAHVFTGDFSTAARELDECNSLAPLHPMAFLFDCIRLVLELSQQNYAAAVALGRTLTELHPGYVVPYAYYLSALGHLDRTEEAARVLARLHAIKPAFTITAFAPRLSARPAQHRENILAGLLRAGVPA